MDAKAIWIKDNKGKQDIYMPEEQASRYLGSYDDPVQSLYQAPLLVHDFLRPYKLCICRSTCLYIRRYWFNELAPGNGKEHGPFFTLPPTCKRISKNYVKSGDLVKGLH